MSAEVLLSGTTPQRSDTRRLLLVKLVNATVAAGSGGGATSGNGSPVGVVDASKFVIYLQKDSVPPLLEWFSNGTTWTT